MGFAGDASPSCLVPPWWRRKRKLARYPCASQACPCEDVTRPGRLRANRSGELADQREAAEQPGNREHDRAYDVKRRKAEFAALIEQRRVERVGRKRGVAAENAGHQKQPPRLRRLALEGEIARDQPHHGRASDVDDEGAPGKSGAETASAGDVDEIAERRAKPATDKDQQIAHRSIFHVSEVTRQTACAAPERSSQGSRTTPQRKRAAAATTALSNFTPLSFRGSPQG